MAEKVKAMARYSQILVGYYRADVRYHMAVSSMARLKLGVSNQTA